MGAVEAKQLLLRSTEARQPPEALQENCLFPWVNPELSLNHLPLGKPGDKPVDLPMCSFVTASAIYSA